MEWLALAAGHKGCGGPGALTQLLVKGTAAVTERCVCVTNSFTAGADPLLSPFLIQEKELPMLQPTWGHGWGWSLLLCCLSSPGAAANCCWSWSLKSTLSTPDGLLELLSYFVIWREYLPFFSICSLLIEGKAWEPTWVSWEKWNFQLTWEDKHVFAVGGSWTDLMLHIMLWREA